MLFPEKSDKSVWKNWNLSGKTRQIGLSRQANYLVQSAPVFRDGQSLTQSQAEIISCPGGKGLRQRAQEEGGVALHGLVVRG